MNYYNPYYYVASPVSSGLGRGLFGNTLRSGINWSGILNGAQRTLGLVNQAIPLVKQAAPMVRNAKTMFKVMNEFKKVETPLNVPDSTNVTNDFEKVDNLNSNDKNLQSISDGGPTFFV